MQEFKTLSKIEIDALYISIGINVKREREKKGLSQLQLSHIIGHNSVSVVSRAEIFHKGVHFNMEHIAKIACALNIDICILLQKN